MRNRLAIWIPLSREQGLGHYYRNVRLQRSIPDSMFVSTDREIEIPDSRSITASDRPGDIEQQFLEMDVGTVLIDHYALPDSVVRHFIDTPRLRTACFDGSFGNPACDAVLNTNPWASPERFGSLHPNTRYFLGPGYYGLRPEVEAAAGSRPASGKCFVCIGGSDPLGITLALVPVLNADWTYDIVLGRGVPESYVREVREAAEKRGLLGQVLWDPADFFVRLATSEFAVLSCSTIVYEATRLGVKAACIQVADNQRPLAEYLRGAGVSVRSPKDATDSTAIVRPESFRPLPPLNLGATFGELVDFLRS